MASRAFTPHGSTRSRLELALSRELRGGERVLWQGNPIGRVNKMAFGMYLFAVPWTAFALLWTTMAAAGVAASQAESSGLLAWAFPLFGLPFIAVGIGMMSGPFLPLWERGKVLFAITNQRILKLRLGRNLKVTSCPAERIGQINRRENRDGSGSLSIAVSVGKDSDGDATVERFIIEEINDVFAAQSAIEQIADSR